MAKKAGKKASGKKKKARAGKKVKKHRAKASAKKQAGAVKGKAGYSALLRKAGASEGDRVVALSGEVSFEGSVVPSEDEEYLVLKLDNGYNIGIAVDEIKNIQKVSGGKAVGKAAAREVKKKPGLPTIAILHTGGTVASRVDYRTGAVYASFTPEDLVALVPEINEIVNFDTKLVANMMSEDMEFSDYQDMARAVEKEAKKGVKGIIIGHGTDTMHYSSAALAFMLENLQIPVILIGAQRSSDRGSSDAAMNMVCAARFIANTDFAGVAICMHDYTSDENCAILPACKTRKMHTSRRDAFRAVNDKPIAKVNYATGEIKFVKESYAKKDGKEKLVVRDNMEGKVAIVKTHTNMSAEQFLFYKKQKYKGLVIEGTGLGHTPIGKNDEIVKAIKEVVDSGCLVVNTSQTIYGRVNLSVYTNLRKLAEAGVVSGEDMLPETAFVKLAWLLGNYKKDEARKLVGQNLRGEITPCTSIKSFDLE